MAGIYPALMTGYERDGSLSLERTGALVDRLVSAKVHGLFVGGTAGEGPVQTADERVAIVEYVSERLDGLPFIVHAGSMVYAETVRVARAARDAGAEQVAAIPPLFYAMTPAALADYYRRLADDVALPIMMYHVPHLTHRHVGADWILDLAREGVLSGVKYSADDMSVAQLLIDGGRDLGFSFYSGSDPQCLSARNAGSTGAVGVSINAMPELFVELWDAAQDDPRAALNAQKTITAFVAEMFRFDFIGYLRHILARQGVDIGANRAPLPPLSAADAADIDARLAADPVVSEHLRLTT